MMQDLEYQGQKFGVYLARPEGQVKGAIIVIHEVWGLVDHIKSVADRYAAEGYVALAPDLLSETDITSHATPELQEDLFNPEKRNLAQTKMRSLMAPMQEPDFASKTLAKLEVCFDYLYNPPEVKRQVAVTGFCFGGSYSYSLALEEPRLKLAMPFYGHVTTDVAELAKIKCPVRAFYGQNDERLIDGLDELKTAMESAGVNFEAKVYPDCGHAFFNDTNKFAYNENAAADAWSRALDLLSQYLAS
ncbi:MAG: dienelactone hydrolase family protein [Candidatus Saccharimonadales bacterium]